MPLTKYGVANLAQGQLLAGIGASSPSLILKTGQGGLFPPSLECPFFIKIEKYDTALNGYRVLKREIAICTNRAGDTLTITRSGGYCPASYSAVTQTNTAFTFDADDTVSQILVGEQIEEIQAGIDSKLDKVGGLRTGMTANATLSTDGSGNEAYVLGAGFVATAMIMPYGGASAPAGYLLCDGAAVSRTTYASLFSVVSTTYGVGDGSTTFNLPNMLGRIAFGKNTATSKWAATITIATPGVVTNAGHGLANGQKIYFTTTGALPTGIVANTRYFIVNATLNTFQISATYWGAAINTTGTQSGVHTLFSSDFSTLGETWGAANVVLGWEEIPWHTHTIGYQNDASWGAPNGNFVSNSNAFIANYSTGSYGWGRPHANIPPYLTLNYIIKT